MAATRSGQRNIGRLSEIAQVAVRHGFVGMLGQIAEQIELFGSEMAGVSIAGDRSRAEIDGQPAEVLRVSCGLMGVRLPAGSHTVILRYQPPRVYALAAVVSIAAFLVGLGLVVRNSVGRG